MPLNKLFNPKPLFQDFRSPAERQQGHLGDRRDGKVYLYTDALVLAINVAMVTGRPLLLRGAPGCGKSSVAYNIARVMGRCYYETVINSRMQANDLCWRFDAIRRLGDAQVAAAAFKTKQIGKSVLSRWESYHPYIESEVLWWVFDRTSARRRGLSEGEKLFYEPSQDPIIYKPSNKALHYRSVVLLDEIDKAEPDVPNNLLVVLGSMQFYVTEIQKTIALTGHKKAKPLTPEDMPLIVITTNEERTLPVAFLRRCVVYKFDPVNEEQLIEIATCMELPDNSTLYQMVARSMVRLAEERASYTPERLELNIAEYLDAVRACQRLGGSKITQQLMKDILEQTTFKKPSYL